MIQWLALHFSTYRNCNAWEAIVGVLVGEVPAEETFIFDIFFVVFAFPA